MPVDHKKNTVTWQAFMAMWVNMENIQTRKWPNGSPMTKADIDSATDEIEACTAILIQHGCELPKLSNAQLNLF